MPFTVSHAAAVLPFRRLNLVWSAFIVGSMAPDFLYIVGSTEFRQIGHRFPGVLWFTLPASLFALWFFHAVVKRPIIGLLPAGMQQRLRDQMGPFHFGGAARFGAILFSIAFGIATHVFWDSLTHPFTWIWWHVPWLEQWVPLPLFGVTPMFEILQYISTFVGLLALLLWCIAWYRRTPAPAGTFPVESSQLALPLLIFVAGRRGGVPARLPASRAAHQPRRR